MATGDERAHAELLRKSHRRGVVRARPLEVRRVRRGHHLSEQTQYRRLGASRLPLARQLERAHHQFQGLDRPAGEEMRLGEPGDAGRFVAMHLRRRGREAFIEQLPRLGRPSQQRVDVPEAAGH